MQGHPIIMFGNHRKRYIITGRFVCMGVDQIRTRIDESIMSAAPYAVFIKPNDADSDCLIKFVKQSGIIATIFDTSTSVGFLEMDTYSLLECDVPCICSTEDHRTLYEGCPDSVDQLRRG